MQAEGANGYKLHLANLDCEQAKDVLMATGLELTLQNVYKAYVRVFLEADSESMPSQSSQDLLSKLLDGR
jgi:fructose-specific phosphotransferase system component IIB